LTRVAGETQRVGHVRRKAGRAWTTRMARKRQTLGIILQEQNIVARADADRAAEYALNNGKRIGEALIELQLASEEDVTRALALQHGMEYVEVNRSTVSPEALSHVPEKIIKANDILPMSSTNGR